MVTTGPFVSASCSAHPCAPVQLAGGRWHEWGSSGQLSAPTLARPERGRQGESTRLGARDGRDSTWEVEPARLDEARRWLDHIAGQWDEALARLQAPLER